MYEGCCMKSDAGNRDQHVRSRRQRQMCIRHRPTLNKPIYISYDYFKKFEELYVFIESNISAEEKNEFVNGNGLTKGLASVFEGTVFFDLLDENQKSVLSTFRLLFESVQKDIYGQNLGTIVEGIKFSPIHVKVQYVNASDELYIEGLKNDGEFGGIFLLGIFITWISTFVATQRFLNLKTDALYY